jgi:KUP system potassium uptake protein
MANSIPPPIIDHVAQIGALYKTLVALMVVFEEEPRVDRIQRIEILNVIENFWHVTIHYGFMEVPDLPAALQQAKELGFTLDLDNAIYFASHNHVIPLKSGKGAMRWRLPLFDFMLRNSVRASDPFNLPAHSVLEIGRQVEI